MVEVSRTPANSLNPQGTGGESPQAFQDVSTSGSGSCRMRQSLSQSLSRSVVSAISQFPARGRQGAGSATPHQSRPGTGARCLRTEQPGCPSLLLKPPPAPWAQRGQAELGGSMWLEESRRLPSHPWGPSQPSAALAMEDCPSGHLGRDALALQQHPYSLEEFAGHSTLHGMRHIFRYRRFTGHNLLWLLAFLGSLALLIHSYAKCVSFYFQYPHNTQLEEETTRNKTFPAVTLCNLNPARYSQLSAHDLYWAGEMLGLLDGAGQPLVWESMERSRMEALLGTLVRNEKEKSRPFNLDEFYRRVGHQLDMGQMLVHCMFSGEECNGSDFQMVSAQWQDIFRGREGWAWPLCQHAQPGALLRC